MIGRHGSVHAVLVVTSTMAAYVAYPFVPPIVQAARELGEAAVLREAVGGLGLEIVLVARAGSPHSEFRVLAVLADIPALKMGTVTSNSV